MALPHAKPGEIVDLGRMGAANARASTSAIIKTDQFEAIRLVVRAGSTIPEHDVSGSITLHCLEGRVELRLESSVIELGPHQWVYLDGGAPHSLKGIEDSLLLLTILFPQSLRAVTE
jgi:quercetin dioxygenase-like cupin family protein